MDGLLLEQGCVGKIFWLGVASQLPCSAFDETDQSLTEFLIIRNGDVVGFFSSSTYAVRG